jgi:tryptophan 2-monooxygenase
LQFHTITPEELVAGLEWVAWPYIDALYDYVEFLRRGPIADLPQNSRYSQVAIVGAGAAGLVAAYELLKIGARPVIYEASNRIGGRAYSLPFHEADGSESPTDFAEMGAMRFPPSCKTLFYYVEEVFNLEVFEQFPDPGKVPTVLYYKNKVINWPAGQDSPEEFKEIARDWRDFYWSFTEPLYQVWQEAQVSGDWWRVRATWQNYIDRFKDLSFYSAVEQGIPHWTAEEMERFGTLGIGSGGFGPMYPVNFLEILRIIVNMWEENQQLLTRGISTLMEKFYSEPVTLPDGSRKSLKDIGALQKNKQVNGIEVGEDGNPILHFGPLGGAPLESKSHRAVIVATTTRAMEVMGLTLPTGKVLNPGIEVLDERVKEGVRRLHLMNSSKLFIRTETKFWKNDAEIPQNIQTDALPRGTYVLDYPQTDHGIVLVSYTWGDDSAKLQGLTKEERFNLFRKIIARASRKFAENLIPLNGEVLAIDWQMEPYYYGAFTLNDPGQEACNHAVYYQFLSALDPAADRGVYLAGDGVSWSGGWIEGALHTGINAACAAAKRIGATLHAESPLTQKPSLYSYD